MDVRQVAIVIVTLVFMAVTVGHVAAYAGSFEAAGWRWLGWPYALGVDVAIALCAWFTRWATTRRWAMTGYALFVLASGVMNVGAVRPWQQEAWLAAWTYSLFPTAAIGLLGFLLRQTETLAMRETKRYTLRLPAFLRRNAQPAPQKPQPAHEPETPAQRNGHGRSFEQFERAVARGTLDLAEMTGEQVGEWAGKSASTGRRWRRRALASEDGRALNAHMRAHK